MKQPPPEGWVYVITNPAMPHLVKVGFTTKLPQQRARQLRATGIPFEHRVQYQMRCKNFREVERLAHRILQAKRADKEWFECGILEAVDAIRQACSLGKNKIFEEDLRTDKSTALPPDVHNRSHSMGGCLKMFIVLLLLVAGVLWWLGLTRQTTLAPDSSVLRHNLQWQATDKQLKHTWDNIAPNIRRRLQEEQGQWQEQTEAHCYALSQGEIASCFIQENQKRIDYLQGYIIGK